MRTRAKGYSQLLVAILTIIVMFCLYSVRTYSGANLPITGIKAGISWSPDSNSIAVATYHGVFILSRENLSVIRVLSPRTWNDSSSTTAVAWHPTLDVLASTETNDVRIPSRIMIWDIEASEITCELVGHENGIDFLAWSPNGRYLASSAWDGTVRLWNVSACEQLQQFSVSSGYYHALSWDPNNEWVITFDRGNGGQFLKFHVLDGSTEVAWSYNDWSADSAKLSPDGQLVLAGDHQSFTLWNAFTGSVLADHPIASTDIAQEVFTWVWSQDSSLVALGIIGEDSATGQPINTIQVWNIQRMEHVATLNFGSFLEMIMTNAIGWSPNGGFLAAASSEGRIAVWDTQNYNLLVETDDYVNVREAR